MVRHRTKEIVMHERVRRFVWEGLGDALDFIFWSIENIATDLKTSYDALPGTWEIRIRYIEKDSEL